MKLIYKYPKETEEVTLESSDRKRVVLSLDQSKKPTLLQVDLLDSYKNFFKFKEVPFSVTPDPQFFFFSHSAAEVLNHLRYGNMRDWGSP